MLHENFKGAQGNMTRIIPYI